MFGLGHLTQHSLFILKRFDESKILLPTAFAYDHHYYDVNVFALDIRYRNIYLVHHLFHPFLLPFYIFSDEISFYTFITLKLFFWLHEAVVHEWYHIPMDKQRNYNVLLYYVFWFFRKVGYVSREKHSVHHLHNFDNMNNVLNWYDHWVPPYFEYIFQKLWITFEGKRSEYILFFVFLEGVVAYLFFTVFDYFCGKRLSSSTYCTRMLFLLLILTIIINHFYLCNWNCKLHDLANILSFLPVYFVFEGLPDYPLKLLSIMIFKQFLFIFFDRCLVYSLRM